MNLTNSLLSIFFFVSLPEIISIFIERVFQYPILIKVLIQDVRKRKDILIRK